MLKEKCILEIKKFFLWTLKFNGSQTQVPKQYYKHSITKLILKCFNMNQNRSYKLNILMKCLCYSKKYCAKKK